MGFGKNPMGRLEPFLFDDPKDIFHGPLAFGAVVPGGVFHRTGGSANSGFVPLPAILDDREEKVIKTQIQMKVKKWKSGRQIFCLSAAIAFSFWTWSGIEGCWAGDASYQIGAPLTVRQPGLVEVPLPPTLHIHSTNGLDLRVLGPEGQNRPFELYWREEKIEETHTLQEKSAQILEKGKFRWQGSLEKPFRVRKIQAYLSAGDYVGKLDVFGLQGNSWKLLAQNAALYQVNGKSWAEVNIPEGLYQTFRLEFVSYDQKYKQKLVPLEQVDATSETAGTKYIEESLSIIPSRVDAKDEIQLVVSLPGSGLWVKAVDLTTEEPFVGDWTLGREEIAGGKRDFVVWRQGQVESLGKGSNTLKLEINDVLNGKALLLKLHPKNYLGAVKKCNVTFQLPRFVFKADKEGVYQVEAGAGESVSILEVPSSENRGSVETATWGIVKTNPNWKPANLLEKYHLGGGPFDGSGYSWQAPISITTPGYYRVLLNQKASLEGNIQSLRVVRQGQQVPYFLSSGEKMEIPISIAEDYDRDKNKSIWIVELPQASQNWDDLLLQSQGIFSRTVILEKQDPGSLAWEPWMKEIWDNREAKITNFQVSLGSLPQGATKVRITIEHGDNRPITIKKISLFYYAPAFCFLADTGDGYELMGGNPVVSAPQYDLSLVEDDLLSQEPLPANLGDFQSYSGQGLKFRLFRVFGDTNWGLYGALGLVTLAMIFLIVRLFPAISDKGPKKR